MAINNSLQTTNGKKRLGITPSEFREKIAK